MNQEPNDMQNNQPATVMVGSVKKSWVRTHPVRSVFAVMVALLAMTWAGLAWMILSGNAQTRLVIDNVAKSVPSQLTYDENTLFVDAKTNSLGVRTSKPSGLQVQAPVAEATRGTANVRFGLDGGGRPAVILEGKGAKQWQLDNADGTLRWTQTGAGPLMQLNNAGLTLEKDLNVKGAASFGTATFGTVTLGNATLGSSASSITTIQGRNVAIPNSLAFGNNALYIGNNGQVAIGSNNPAGNKLLVSGNFRSTGSTEASLFVNTSDSASNPGFTWAGNTDTGMFRAGTNAIGFSAGGNEVLRVEPGLISSRNGANIEAEGYLRAGREGVNPSWRIARYTGTLDGGGAAAFGHGINNGQLRIINVMAFYKGNSGEAKFLSVDEFNGSTVQISGGIPGRPYRAMIIYTADAPVW